MSESMRFKPYVCLVAAKVEEAEDRVDKDECARLVRLLREACSEYLDKVEKSRQAEATG